jgi:WD40 repeat protein
MLILQSALSAPTGLTFSPDGLALLAVEGSRVQVWPRWLDAPPRPAQMVQNSLERYAFSPAADHVYLYVSGNSFTRVLDVATGTESATALPSGGPSWFHFTSAGGFVLVSHSPGKLTRFNYAPKAKARFRKSWSITRSAEDESVTLGSHYRFGAICGPAGVFVALEYRYGGSEPIHGLVVRSVSDGAQIRRQALSARRSRELLHAAGLTLSVHPSGRYFAYPQANGVRLWPLVRRSNLPDAPAAVSDAPCRAVAFHPSGTLLAAVSGDAVALYDTATWQVARTFAWGIGALHAVCFSPDGTRAAVIAAGPARKRGKKATGGKIVVWDLDV